MKYTLSCFTITNLSWKEKERKQKKMRERKKRREKGSKQKKMSWLTIRQGEERIIKEEQLIPFFLFSFSQPSVQLSVFLSRDKEWERKWLTTADDLSLSPLSLSLFPLSSHSKKCLSSSFRWYQCPRRGTELETIKREEEGRERDSGRKRRKEERKWCNNWQGMSREECHAILTFSLSSFFPSFFFSSLSLQLLTDCTKRCRLLMLREGERFNTLRKREREKGRRSGERVREKK